MPLLSVLRRYSSRIVAAAAQRSFSLRSSLHMHPFRYLAFMTVVATGAAGTVGVTQMASRHEPPRSPAGQTGAVAGISRVTSNHAGSGRATDANPASASAGQSSAAAGHAAVSSVQVSSSSDSGAGGTRTSVTVNGEAVVVPQNGSLSTHIAGPGGDASVHISHSSSGNTASSSTTVEVTSASEGQNR